MSLLERHFYRMPYDKVLSMINSTDKLTS